MQRWNCCRRGVDGAVIALWLGQSVETTQTYLHAHLALKEAALAALAKLKYEGGINRKDERLDPQAWLTDVLSHRRPSRRRSPTSASRVSSSSSKSTGNRRRPESAEINDERRPAVAHPGRVLRILMKFVKP